MSRRVCDCVNAPEGSPDCRYCDHVHDSAFTVVYDDRVPPRHVYLMADVPKRPKFVKAYPRITVRQSKLYPGRWFARVEREEGPAHGYGLYGDTAHDAVDAAMAFCRRWKITRDGDA